MLATACAATLYSPGNVRDYRTPQAAFKGNRAGPQSYKTLTPLVQDDELVCDWNASSLQPAQGADNAFGRQIARWVIVLPNDKNPRMMALSLLDQVSSSR